MAKSKIETMLDKVRQAMADCDASEKDVMKAMVVESEGWKMRLEEIEQEEEGGGG